MRRVLILLALVLGVAGTVAAQTNYNILEKGWYLNTSLGVTINPFRGVIDTQLYHRVPLMNKPGMLWKSTKLDWGIKNLTSPALEYLGAIVSIEPIAVFQLTAEVGAVRYFPLLGYGFLTYNDLSGDYSSDTRKDITATNKASHNAFMATVQPSFRVALGPIALVHNITWQYVDYFTNAIVYDYMNVILRRGADSYITHDTLLLYQTGDWRMGLAHHYGYMYGTGEWIERAMVMGAWTPKVQDVNPYFILQLGYNLRDFEYQDQLYVAVKVGANFKLTK